MEALHAHAEKSFRIRFGVPEEKPDEHSSTAGSTHGVPDDNEDPPVNTTFNTFEVRHTVVPEQKPWSPVQQLPGSQLSTFFTTTKSGELLPRLKLIEIQSRHVPYDPSVYDPNDHRTRNVLSLDISRSVFHGLLKQLQASPYATWLLNSKYDGFHYTRAQDQYTDTYFYGNSKYAMIWTFVPAIACTRVLLVNRHFFFNPWAADNGILALINSYAPHLLTPFVPLMAIALDTMIVCETNMDIHARRISQVEQGTNFSFRPQDTLGAGFEIDLLSEWSQTSARVNMIVIRNLRHYENAMKALNMMKDRYNCGHLKCPHLAYEAEYNKSMAAIVDSVDVLKMRADSFMSYTTSIQNRAETQTSVIFALLSHEDSVSNLKLAEASMAIAEATRRDSSAMKTVAVVTMAFLPATFLAAFFALPVFEWEQRRQLQMDGMQLYWAVTIPATAAVFSIWAIATQRHRLVMKLLGHMEIEDAHKQKEA